MKTFSKCVAPLAVCAGMILSPVAAATPFAVTAVSLVGGSGYGPESGANVDTTLAVAFSTSTFTSQSFLLTTLNQSKDFVFGSVVFSEPNGNPGIEPAETDNLGLTANFVFVNPVGGSKTVTATGTATVGKVNQGGAYSIHWTPMNINFGTSGVFSLSLNDLTFLTDGNQTLTATVKLTTLDSEVTNAVPEPAPLALFALGALALGLSRRAKFDVTPALVPRPL